MPLIILIALLSLLKHLEVWRFGEVSWWHIVGLMVAAFIWFEFIEKMLGLDKTKEHDALAKRRKDRVAQAFEKKK